MTDIQFQHGGVSAPIMVVPLDFEDRFRRGELLLEPGHFGIELIHPLLEGAAPGVGLQPWRFGVRALREPWHLALRQPVRWKLYRPLR